MIIDAAPEPFKTLFAVAAETGMRSGALYGLRVEDVDFKTFADFRSALCVGRQRTEHQERKRRPSNRHPATASGHDPAAFAGSYRQLGIPV